MNGKFKVWDKEKEKFVQDERKFLIESNGTLWAIVSEKGMSVVDSDKFEIFYKIGLTDMHGEEITVGDFLECYNNTMIVKHDVCPDTEELCLYLENTKEDFTTYKCIGLENRQIVGHIKTHAHLMEGDN